MLNSKRANVIISLVVAVLLWMYVVGQVDPQVSATVDNVPIEFINEDELNRSGLALAAPEVDEVDVTLVGGRASVMGVDAEDLSATVNLLGLERGRTGLQVNVTAPDGARVAEISPESIVVTIEDLVTETREVRAEFTGSVADKEPGNVTVEPERLTVSGAASNVENVAYVAARVRSDRIGNDETAVTARTLAVNGQGGRVEHVTVSQESAQVTATMMHTKTVQFTVNTVGNVGAGYKVDSMSAPDQITIKGPESVLADIDEVESEPVDISGITSTTTLRLTPDLPEGVEPANDSENISLRIRVSEISGRSFTFSGSDVHVENLRNGYEASVITDSIEVVLRNSRGGTGNISKNDVRLYVQGRNLDSATHQVRLRYTTGDGVEVISVNPERVRVRVTGQ